MVRKALAGCTVSVLGRNPAWNNDQHKKITQWLSHLSGRFSSQYEASVTHFIVSKKRWAEDPKPKPVRDALDKGDVKIVTFEWLEDCLTSQSKKREAPYEWVNIDVQAAKLSAKGRKAAEKAATRAEHGKAKSLPGIMSEVFHESTEQFVDPQQKEKLEQNLERERQERKEREMREKEETIRRRKEQAHLFGAGAKKAKSILLTDTYHIYVDNTGFKYDVLVTKIDVRLNQNQRWALTLQVFESNETPHLYAMNAQISGTKTLMANNVICALGSTYYAAMHAFKSEFQRLTGLDWDARLSSHVKRLRGEQHATSSQLGSVRGVPISESAVQIAATAAAGEGFEYYPPGYGPKGDVTPAERAGLKELGLHVMDSGLDKFGKEDMEATKEPAVQPMNNRIDAETSQAVEKWIKGADITPAPPAPPQQTLEDVDLEAMMAEHEYPFEKTFGRGQAPQRDESTDNPETPQQQQQAGPNSPGVDWEAVATDLAGDPAWLEPQLAEFEKEDQTQFDPTQPDLNQLDFSVQPQVPSFETNPTADMLFHYGTQHQSETQVAEKAGGEFLEELGNEQQPPPPLSGKKAGGEVDAETGRSKGLLGGVNLGNSVLGKRKGRPETESGGGRAEKAVKES